MKPVDGVAGSSGVPVGFDRRPRLRPSAETAMPQPGRALVALRPVSRNETPATTARRADAAFIAHLIATQQGLPQTRERRRGDPDTAVAAYGKAGCEASARGRVLAVTR